MKWISQYYKLSQNLCAALLFTIVKSRFCISMPVQNWCSTDKASLEILSCFGDFCIWGPSQKPSNSPAHQNYVVTVTCWETSTILATAPCLYNDVWDLFLSDYSLLKPSRSSQTTLYFSSWCSLHNIYQQGTRIERILFPSLNLFGSHWCFSKFSIDLYYCAL